MGAGCCKEEAIDFTSEIELSHFHLLRSVGKGAFGKVRVVQHKKTKEIYALKYINKAKCIRMRAVENIIQERRLLEEVEFSLICNLRYAFQDDENLFMILDLMLGGDLRFHLERAGPMREDVVRFYVAELALALDALHSRRIIHRDLKPDNVLLDEHGHAHLTDFNIAVYYHPSKPLVSIAGSMAYMAPEVLLRKGYFESVDWWSLGVVMFELLFGKRPFRGKSNDLLTNSILRDPLPFPDNVNDMVSANCLDVLSKLCERDISKRLGCTSEGLDGFKKHPWFAGIEWDKLVTKEAIPPFEPDSKRANFDATHELEELLMEDNPLKAKKRAQMAPDAELSIEMQMMEDKFIVYDFSKVKRSHSLSRGSKTLRPAQDQKLSSGTLDGAVARTPTSNSSGHGINQGGRHDNLPMASAPAPAAKMMVYRPDSPSDRVGQDRFVADEDQVSLMNSSYKNSPLSSPMLQGTHRIKPESEKSAYQQPSRAQHQQHSQHQRMEPEPLQSEAIILPPSSLPRPLQPRDNVTGMRVGSPRHYPSNSNSNSTSTTPSSPSQSFGHSTLTSSIATPPTTQNSSPATVKGYNNNQHGMALFSTPDSTLSSHNSTMVPSPLGGVAPLMDSASIPTPSRRTVRGRESSSAHSVNSMPSAGPNGRIPSLYQQQLASHGRRPSGNGNGLQQPSGQQQFNQQQQLTRPMSAYTTGSTPQHGGVSAHEDMFASLDVSNAPNGPMLAFRQPSNSSMTTTSSSATYRPASSLSGTVTDGNAMTSDPLKGGALGGGGGYLSRDLQQQQQPSNQYNKNTNNGRSSKQLSYLEV